MADLTEIEGLMRDILAPKDLGDGVYLQFDEGGDIKLSTLRLDGEHFIMLDQDVLTNLNSTMSNLMEKVNRVKAINRALIEAHDSTGAEGTAH